MKVLLYIVIFSAQTGEVQDEELLRRFESEQECIEMVAVTPQRPVEGLLARMECRIPRES